MSVSVKAFLSAATAPEIRRFQLPMDVSTSYEYLRSKIASVFPSLNEGNFKLYWKDSDGDEVRFSCDDELIMAMSSCHDDTFRVYIKLVDGSESAKGPKDQQDADNTAHPHVVCDVCNSNIRGIRYKCCMCPDFDLCSACEQTGAHSEHVMLRIVKPMAGGFHGGNFGPWFTRFMGSAGRGHPYCPRNRGRPAYRCGANASGCKPPGPSQHESQPAGSEGHADSGGDPGADFLKNIGEGIANMLGSFGVDVHYDIEHNGPRTCPQGRCHDDNPAPSTSKQAENMDTSTNETAAADHKATSDQNKDDQSSSSSHSDSQSTSSSHSESQSASGIGEGAQSASGCGEGTQSAYGTGESTQSASSTGESPQSAPNPGAQFFNQQEVMESMTRAFNLLASMGFNVNGHQK